jgi:hypothetical protein
MGVCDSVGLTEMVARDDEGAGETGGDMSPAGGRDDMFAGVLLSGLCPVASVVARLVVVVAVA